MKWPWTKAPAPPKRAHHLGRPSPGLARPSWFPGVQNKSANPYIQTEKDLRTYAEMRLMFPVLDSAVKKLTRLVGIPEIEGTERACAELRDWMKNVQVNQIQRGLPTWLRAHVDQMLVYGKALGEMVPNTKRTDLFALTNIDPKTILLSAAAGPLDLKITQQLAGPPFRVELPKEWILFSINATDGDNPHGASLFRSVPFVAEVMSIIQNAVGQQWERSGAPSFHVNWEPPNGFQDPDGSFAQEFLADLSGAWLDSMSARRDGHIQDFLTAGMIKVSSIGADSRNLEIQEPFRAMAEQMVAATGMPAWLLGLHWSTTERLSAQQADIIIADVTSFRDQVQPQIERILEKRQLLAGRKGQWRLTWPTISLRDLVETARADVMTEQAKAARLKRATTMLQVGLWDRDRVAREVDPQIDTAALPAKLSPPPTTPTNGRTPGPPAAAEGTVPLDHGSPIKANNGRH